MNDVSSNFFLGSSDMRINFEDFRSWAYSNIDTPMIRGQLIEFFLVRYLRRKAFRIAAPIIKEWTSDNPSPRTLNKSTGPFYEHQPHLDTFDLQLHWGLTYEFKSTDSQANWTLPRTCRWNPFSRTFGSERIFPAQFYVLAFLHYENQNVRRQFQFPEPTFYIKTGRQLDIDTKIPHDKLKAKHEEIDQIYYDSIRFSRFIKGAVEVPLRDLVCALANLATGERDLLLGKIDGPWKITPPEERSLDRNDKSKAKRIYIPFAFADGKCAWFEEVDGRLTYVKSISPPKWLPEAEIGWRDWESVGFRFVNHNFPA